MRALCDPAVSAKSPDRLVTLGRISGVFGVKGWVKVHSYTEPRDNVVRFAVGLRTRGVESTMEIEDGRSHGANVVAKLRGVESPERARELIGADIVVERAALPECAPVSITGRTSRGSRFERLEARRSV